MYMKATQRLIIKIETPKVVFYLVTRSNNVNGQPDGRFNSSPNFNPLLAPGQTFEHTFTEAIEYPYFCLLYPNMVGIVQVG